MSPPQELWIVQRKKILGQGKSHRRAQGRDNSGVTSTTFKFPLDSHCCPAGRPRRLGYFCLLPACHSHSLVRNRQLWEKANSHHCPYKIVLGTRAESSEKGIWGLLEISKTGMSAKGESPNRHSRSIWPHELWPACVPCLSNLYVEVAVSSVTVWR